MCISGMTDKKSSNDWECPDWLLVIPGHSKHTEMVGRLHCLISKFPLYLISITL